MDASPIPSCILNPASSILLKTPRLGQIKGGESTQAIGASFWLATAGKLCGAREKRNKKCPGSALPGGKERASLNGHSVGFIFHNRLQMSARDLFLNSAANFACRNALAWVGQAENPPKPLGAFGWLNESNRVLFRVSICVSRRVVTRREALDMPRLGWARRNTHPSR